MFINKKFWTCINLYSQFVFHFSKGTLVPSLQNVTCHAIIVSNSVYDGIGIKAQQCIKDRETLRMALLKTGWKCGMF